MSDPDFNKVVALFPFDTDLVDKSLNVLTATPTGTTAITTAQKKFGTGSLSIPTNSSVQISDSPTVNPQARAFTIEFWVRYNYTANALMELATKAPIPSSSPYSIVLSDNYIGEIDTRISALSLILNGVGRVTITPPAKNTWHHVAVSKQDTTCWLAVGGVVTQGVAPAVINTSIDPIQFKNIFSSLGEEGAELYVENFRFTDGEALYKANFTPPIAPFPFDDTVTLVPDVVGLTQAQAISLIEGRGLIVTYGVPEYSAATPINSVISQSPLSGTEVGVGGSVALTLSLGTITVAMPNLTGLTQPQAAAALVAAGIPANIHVFTSDYTGRVAEGIVVTQSPATGTNVVITPVSDFVVVSISKSVSGVGPFFIASEYDPDTVTYVANSYLLGVPAPTVSPTADAVFKSSFTLINRTEVDWDFTWRWYWEEPDGTRSDEDEGTVTPVEEVAGRRYSFTVPARVSATADSRFILWAEVSKGDQNWGVSIPVPSQFTDSSTARVHSAAVSSLLEGDIKTPAETCTITFDYAISDNEYSASRQYAVTYVNRFGDEGAPSVITVDSEGNPRNITVHPFQQALINYDSAYIPFDYAISKCRIYRTVTDFEGTSFRFVAEVEITGVGLGQLLFVDTLYDDATQEGISTTFYDMPVKGLKGLVSMPGGFAAGFDGNTVYFSEPYQLHAWPKRYAVGVDAEVVGLGVIGNSLVILTNRTPYYASGAAPDSMLIRKIDATLPCINYESIVPTIDRVYFNSLNGIAFVAEDGFGYLTEHALSRQIWQDFRNIRPLGMFYNGYLIYSFLDESDVGLAEVPLLDGKFHSFVDGEA